LPDTSSSPARPRPKLVVPGPRATTKQRWRFRRDLVIYVAARQGLSQRFLADVFDLPRSRIGSIVQAFADLDRSAAAAVLGSFKSNDSKVR
jgi:hypothetical protein